MLYIRLDKENKRNISRQIYTQLREKILSGELRSGERLPSTREISKELLVSRNTVMTVFDMLSSDGLVCAKPGSGVYVGNIWKTQLSLPKVKEYTVPSLSEEIISPDMISFDSGIPALNLFPLKKWSRYVSRAFDYAPLSALGYDDPQGRPELRNVLADYLAKSRGIVCDSEQIIITSGAKQGISLIAKCLLNSRSKVIIEDPSNANVRQIFSYHTKNITPIPVDKFGIMTQSLPSDTKYDMIFVTPSHQFPMGSILPVSRRIELVKYARENDCFLIEDDYDSEFQFDGAPVRSIYELDSEHVVYIGTFSKIMFPSMRLGYMVLPHSLVAQCREIKRLADHHSNSIYQLALTEFIKSGELASHIRRMKKVYHQRRDSLLQLLDIHFQGKYHVFGKDAGMHTVASFDNYSFNLEAVNHARENGIYIVPVEEHAFIKGNHNNQLILGYSNLDSIRMEEGLSRLKKLIL